MTQSTKNIEQSDSGDGSILIFPWAYSAIAQGTWAFATTDTIAYNGYFYNTSNAQGDQLNFKVWLSKGTYGVTVKVYDGASRCFLSLLYESNHISMHDAYGSGYQRRVTFPHPIGVSTSGLKTISLKCGPGRNNSSTGWTIPLLQMRVTRAI